MVVDRLAPAVPVLMRAPRLKAEARAGEPVAVMPILVFPSWYVAECKPRRTEIRVVNPKYLLGAIASRQQVLTATQINLYARQVALLCRDVKL